VYVPFSHMSTKQRSTFRMECSVRINIRAIPGKIFGILTNAGDFPRWNSTVKSIEGMIAEGERIKVRTPTSDRVFKLKVSNVVRNQTMTWSDGFAPMFKGVRTFTLKDKGDGTTDFEMREVFSGLMLPMIAGSLPDLGPVFDQYAADLKAAAE
jgi:hypothetical protein